MSFKEVEENLNDISTITTSTSMVRFLVDKKNQAQELLIRWKYEQVVILAQQTLDDYLIFKKKSIKNNDPVCQLVLDSHEAGFELLMQLAKIRDKQINCDEIDLNALKTFVIQSYKCKVYPGLFCMVSGRFSQIFLENKYFGIAKTFYILATDAFENLEVNGSKFNFFRSIGVNSYIPPLEAHHFRLNDELQYLVRLFEQSVQAINKPLEVSVEKASRDCIFDNLLETMNVVSNYTFTKIVQTKMEAQQLFDVIYQKLKDLQLCLSRQDPSVHSNKVFNTTEISVLFNKYWLGLIYHYLAFFEDESDKKLALMYRSMEPWELLLKEHYTPNHIKIYHEKHPNLNAISIYCNLLDKSVSNLGYMINIRSESLLVFAAPLPVLESINDQRRKIISLMMESIAYMETCGNDCTEKDKVFIYFEIARNLRSIISKNKNTHENNMKESVKYIKLWVQALLSDLNCYLLVFRDSKEHSELVKNWNDIQGKSHDDFVYQVIEKIDEEAFIKKFRR